MTSHSFPSVTSPLVLYSFVICYLLFIIYYLLFIIYYLLFIIYYLFRDIEWRGHLLEHQRGPGTSKPLLPTCLATAMRGTHLSSPYYYFNLFSLPSLPYLSLQLTFPPLAGLDGLHREETRRPRWDTISSATRTVTSVTSSTKAALPPMASLMVPLPQPPPPPLS